MDDNVVKHMEITLDVISRLAGQSFAVKRLSVLVVAGGLGLAAVLEARGVLLFGVSFLIVVFWFLDGYYFWRERLFRGLYDRLRIQTATDYSMETVKYRKGIWYRHAVFSGQLVLFYGSLLGLTGLLGLIVWLGISM